MTLKTALALLTTFSVGARAADYNLQGLRYRNATTPNTLNKASMGGGLELFIDGDGAGFDNLPKLNQVKFTTTQGNTATFTGPDLSRDDEFQSNTVAGRLAYTLPSISELIGGPIELINHHYVDNNDVALKFELSVDNTFDQTESACIAGREYKCQVYYRLDYTPLVHEIIPNQVFDGSAIDVMVNPWRANEGNAISSDMEPVVHIKIDGTRCDTEDFFDYTYRLSGYRVGTLKARVSDQLPGNHVPEVRFRVGNALLRESSKHCNFAGDDCWYVKTHPKIDSISNASGYTTGGQTLTISGWGLKGETMDDVEVLVDGVPCTVQSSTLDSITCVTGAASQVSFEGPQPGSPGLTHEVIDPTDDGQWPYWGMKDDGVHPVVEKKVLTGFEAAYNNYTRAATHSQGWFKAPETGNYRFYMSCDDFCKVWLNSVDKFDGTKTDAYDMPEIIRRNSWTQWRNYHTLAEQPDSSGNSWTSAWIPLEKDEFYKIEGFHAEGGGEDHYTVSVEFEKADTAGHHHANKEVQVLEAKTDFVNERFNITITGETGSTFKVRLLNPKYDSTNPNSIKQVTTDDIKDDENNRWTVRNRLVYFFSKIWGADIEVNIYHTNDLYEDVDPSVATQRVYNVKLLRAIDGVSFNVAQIIPAEDSLATVTIAEPYIWSSTPLTGNFAVVCADRDGFEYKSRDFSIWQDINSMQLWISLDIPHLQSKINIRDLGLYRWRDNGLSFQFEFQDLHEDPSECMIVSGTNQPLEGGNANTTGIIYETNTTRPYGQNLMFEPVPMEMLYTDAYKPQVRVKVNGIDAVCPNFNCDYVYTAPTDQVTEQTLNEVTTRRRVLQTLKNLMLIIDGTDLPTSGLRIVFANVECGDIVATSSRITCTLADNPAAGAWTVQLFSDNGLSPVDIGSSLIFIPLEVDSISPNTGLNQLGGDLITITGAGFDTVLAGMSVTASDGTVCDIVSATSTSLQCIPRRFDLTTDDHTVPRVFTVRVNSITNSDFSVMLLPTAQQGQSVSPNSVSPVLTADLTVTLDATYPGPMTSRTDFTCQLVDSTNMTNTRSLYVMAVDSTAKTVTIKYSGAASGVYYLRLEGTGVGRIGWDALELTVEGKITAISPLQGSYLGGTKITIDGINFSDGEITDNPVKVGNYYCLVESTSATQIVCRVSTTIESDTSQAEVVVFLRTFEEAKRADGLDNIFNLNAPVASVTGLTSAFDAATNTEVLTLTGTGFGTDASAIELLIDGEKQTCLTAADTTATFTLSTLMGDATADVAIYFADGLPAGYDTISSISFTPNLVSIYPATGSAGGTLLEVDGTGFGVNTEGVTLTIGGTDICEEVIVYEYGYFTCMTKAMEITSADVIMLQTSAGSFSCANTLNAADCVYEQLIAGSPTVTGATTANGNTITLTGTLFPTGDYATVTFKGVPSTVAIINSDTQVTATFDFGVPVAATAMAPKLTFSGDTDIVAVQDPSIKITNDLTITASTSGLSCSFAGGCPYTVTAASLTASLLDSETNSIDVCGYKCAVDVTNSDHSQATCIMPYMPTTYSSSQYEINKRGLIVDGTWTGTCNAANLALLIDGDNTINTNDGTSTDPFVQIEYKENHVGVLDEAKFFINSMNDKTPYTDGNLVFQGSNDGVTFDDLWTIDDSVHEGWNSYDFSDSKPAYHMYRFQGKIRKSTRFGEIRLYGIESIDDNNASFSCTPKVTVDGAVTDLSPVTFAAASTPVLTGLSTRFVSVKGGEQITLTGTGFSASETTTVKIDDRLCTVDAQTTTTITCTTDDKPYVPDSPKLEINIAGTGNVATMGKEITYVYRWSDPDTWGTGGGDIPPQDGDSVFIPKGQHLLFDLDQSPKLNFLNVEGSLIFAPDADPNHFREFDANMIFVKGGKMEVGTEENRYTSKIQITLWGAKYDPSIPMFGNKGIGVYFGTLDMHGIERPITWTELESTAEAGATSITLMPMQNGAVLDWQVGEDIVIASTSYIGRDAETRTIASISNADTSPVITFTQPLNNKHYAGRQIFGAGTANEDFIDMRAEVGLLTRNVQFRGDPVHSPDNEYGAVIRCASPGDESAVCRLDSIEVYHVGQAAILGSYPIHFHMIGTVLSSYVRNNAIHHTFNRAVTIHGVQYLRIQNNVAYNTKGHTIFIEDGAETKNLIENNLVVDVRRSFSLLNTDSTPACFWITNPDNIFRGNHAAGSDRYSYWFDLQVHPTGPSFDVNMCPEQQKLGEFSDNVAHSNGRYGLRIFHNHIPREKQCKPLNYDDTSASYNPPIIAEYRNLVSWKNQRTGAIMERAGAVHFINFKTADNLQTGMEWALANDNKLDGYARIIDGMVVGRTENTEEALDLASPVGVKTARSELLSVSGVKFYNYNWNDAAGMATCSHCEHDASTDSGGRTITVWDLFFDDLTVQKRVQFTTPFRTIFYDKSGSMTNKDANSWFLPYWKHLLQPECTQEDAMGGIACDSSVEARRIALWNMPGNFRGMRLKIAKFDAADEAALTANNTIQTYLDDEANYSIVPFKRKLNPEGWAVPYITSHRYRLHWERGLDFNNMRVEISERWQPTDQNLFMVFNFTESREAVNITSNYGSGMLRENNTLETKAEADWLPGDMQMRNTTIEGEEYKKEFEFVVNGKGDSHDKFLVVKPLKCILGVCPQPDVNDGELESSPRSWAFPGAWDSGELPKEGDDIVINATQWFELDIAETPMLNSIEINGRLSFKDDASLPIVKLRAKKIFVRAGNLRIGTVDAPFTQTGLVELGGDTESETLELGSTISAGNKVLAASGLVELFGQPRVTMSRLLATVSAGATEITVEDSVDWQVGEQIYIAPSTVQFTYSEYKTITAISSGVITLDSPLSYYHYGKAESTGADYNGVDMRTEVFLLTRNVKVYGNAEDNWAGHIMATDVFENDGTLREGQLIMDNVEVDNCSQDNVGHAAIRFESAVGSSTSYSRISNSAIHNGQDWGLSIVDSENIEIINNVFVGWDAIGARIDSTRNVTIQGNFVGDVKPRDLFIIDKFVDKEACWAIGSFENSATGTKNPSLTFTDNIAAGCPFAGFIAPGYENCGDVDSKFFFNNVAHSVEMYGAYMYANPISTTTTTCMEWSHFAAYKTAENCAVTFVPTKLMKAHDITCIDIQMGLSLNTGGADKNEVKIMLEDSIFYGETEADDCPSGNACSCANKYAIMSAQNVKGSKALMPTSASVLPIFKLKSDANWGGEIIFNRNTFKNFVGTTMCGARQVIFERNPTAADKIAPHFFFDTVFDNVDDVGFAFFDKPNPGWANPTDCGDFPCTGPLNMIYTFEGNVFQGTNQISTAQTDFVLVPNEETVGGTYPSCVEMPAQQLYVCQATNIGMLMFESLDADGFDRALQPVFLLNEETGFNNTLNAFMDHLWDGFYTSQRRMPRFPAALTTGQDYTLQFTSTLPKKMRFTLDAQEGGTKIKVPYGAAGAYAVSANGVRVEPNAYDDSIQAPGALTKDKGCGENRFVGIYNYLEFWIEPGCTINVVPKDSIMAKVRMDWTMDEFFADGGTTTFIDRLAASLGVESYQIKIVSTYTGSVIVDFQIEPDAVEEVEPLEEDPNWTAEELAAAQQAHAEAVAAAEAAAEAARLALEAVKTELVDQAVSGDLATTVGAPVLGLEEVPGEEGGEATVLAGDPIPPPPGLEPNVTLSAVAGTMATFAFKQNDVLKSELSIYNQIDRRARREYSITYDISLNLLDNQVWSFPDDKQGAAFEMDVCVVDGTATTPWNCIYTMMPRAEYNENESMITTYQKHVAQADLPDTSPQTEVSRIDSPACQVNQIFTNGKGLAADGTPEVVGKKLFENSVLEDGHCEMGVGGTGLTQNSIKSRIVVTLADLAAATAIKTGLAQAHVKGGYAPELGQWFSFGGQTLNLIDVSPSIPINNTPETGVGNN